MDRRPSPRPFLLLGAALVIGGTWLTNAQMPPVYSAPTLQGWQATTHTLPLAFIPNRGEVNSAVRFLVHDGPSTVFLTANGMTILTGRRSSGLQVVSAQMAVSSSHAASAVRALSRAMAVSPSLPRRTKARSYGVASQLWQGRAGATRSYALSHGLVGETAKQGSVVQLTFQGANAHLTMTGAEQLPGKANFFLGKDPRRWRTDLPTYAAVREHGVYHGVDLAYRASTHLEYDWVLHPGASASAIRMQIEGGAHAAISSGGNLTLRVGRNLVVEGKPHIYEPDGRIVRGGFVVRGRSVGFQIGPYDRSKVLVIDPKLSYSTYLGGSGSEQGLAVAADTKGNTYIAGATTSNNFPTASALQSQDVADSTAFVAKLNRAGTAIVYSTYMGGSSTDEALALAVDAHGSAYIAGDSLSFDYPTVHAFQAANRTECTSNDQRVPCPNAIVTKLNPKGDKLVFSTYLGGNIEDEANGIAVDASGNVYLAGRTFSTNFPTLHAIQPHLRAPICFDETGHTAACSDAWAAKLDPTGSQLLYSTYLGGGKNDEANGVAIDTQGNAYVCGDTFSSDFPTVRPVQSAASLGGDAFVFELNPTGTALVYSTYLGGRRPDVCMNIAVADGTAFVTGFTWSPDFPTTVGAFDRTPHSLEAFVTRIASGGGEMLYSTLLGGKRDDEAFGIAVDSRDRAYVAGDTNSSDFPTKRAAQSTYAGNTDAFVTELNAKGSALVQSTYLGGSNPDYGHGIGLDPEGNVYVIGFTFSTNFPTVHAIRGASGDDDAFIARLGNRKTVLLAKHVP